MIIVFNTTGTIILEGTLSPGPHFSSFHTPLHDNGVLGNTSRLSLYPCWFCPYRARADLVGMSMTTHWTGLCSFSHPCLEEVEEGPGLSDISYLTERTSGSELPEATRRPPFSWEPSFLCQQWRWEQVISLPEVSWASSAH